MAPERTGRADAAAQAQPKGLRQSRPMPLAPRTFALHCHPATPCDVVTALGASATPAPDGGLHLRFVLTGDLARLRIPTPAAQPGATDGLWRHTCCEAFVATPHDAAYREFNLSPSGDWAAYRFSAERQRDTAAPPLPAPRIVCTHDAQALHLQAWLPPEALPPPTEGRLLGLTAVIEQTDGRLSYWALAHAAARPDFHLRASWA